MSLVFIIFHENFKRIISTSLLILTLKEQCKYKLPFSNKQDHYIAYISKTNCYSMEKQIKPKTSTTQNLQKAEFLKFNWSKRGGFWAQADAKTEVNTPLAPTFCPPSAPEKNHLTIP